MHDKLNYLKGVFPKTKKHRLKDILAKLEESGEVNLHGDELRDRIAQILSLGKDSSSLNSLQLRFGDILGKQKYENKCKACGCTRQMLIDKHGKEQADKMLKAKAISLEIFQAKYGEIEGMQRWNQYKEKRNKTYQEKKKAGYDYNSFKIERYINKYGETEGKLRYNQMVEKRIFNTSKAYLVEEFGREKANEIAKARWGLTSLEAFKTRYGDSEGSKRFNEFVEKLKASNKNRPSLEDEIDKFNSSNNIEIRKDLFFSKSRASKIATDFFKNLCKFCNINQKEVKFGDNEQLIPLRKEEREVLGQNVLFPDFKFGNKIIEFFGDKFHANPQIYKEDSTPSPFDAHTLAKDIWEKDRLRILILEKRGYEVLVVWEQDVKKNASGVLNSCKTFLGV